MLLLLVLRRLLARLRGWMKSTPLFNRVNASCNLELLPSQVHTCHNCGKDIHGKVIADILGICVVTQLPSDMSVLFCKRCSSSNKLVDKSVNTAVKTGEAAFAAALAPSKKPQATGSNTATRLNS